MTDCLILCADIKRATNLFKALIGHFANLGIKLRVDRARREFSILTTDIRVVTEEELHMKCKAGFRGKVISEKDAWRMLDEEKRRLNKQEEV